MTSRPLHRSPSFLPFGVNRNRRGGPRCIAAALVSLWALPSSGCGSGQDDAGTSDLAPVQVFLMAGQSNMEGYGPIADSDSGNWPLSGSLAADTGPRGRFRAGCGRLGAPGVRARPPCAFHRLPAGHQ